MRSLVTTAILVASLALGGNAAMAANLPAHKYVRANPHTHAVAPRQFNADIGQFVQSMFGGAPVRYSRVARDTRRAAPSYSGYSDWTPSYDSSPTVDTSAADAAASDAAIQALNDENALNASIAAAEAQNDAANAATLQTEINANNN
jgi:hypothetical protein